MTPNSLAWLSTPKPSTGVSNKSRLADLFTDTDIFDSHSKLVRESVQNSIDARLSPPSKMRFFVGHASSETGKKYFEDQIPRFQKCLRGLPDFDLPFKYIVIEDFNTTGLLGSTDHTLSEEDPRLSSYFYFTWATGTTNKGGKNLGKNGVGKVVYQITSNVNSCLVFSSRADSSVPDEPSNLLFGKCVLDPHELNGVKWLPESQWMIDVPSEGGSTYLPSSDEVEINSFRDDFTIARKLNESGTSIVIPYVDEDFSARRLAQCVAQDYFIAILDGRVEVLVGDDSGYETYLDRSTVVEMIENFDPNLDSKSSKSKRELLRLCAMHQARSGKLSDVYELSAEDNERNSWTGSSEKLSESDLTSIRNSLHSESVLEFRIPVFVPKLGKEGMVKKDAFTVLIQREEKSNVAATFSREGILIPKAAPKQISGYVALVLIDEGPLADFLGLAEGPAHQYWSSAEEKFEGIYLPKIDAEETIKFVRESVKSLFQLIQHQKDEFDDRKYAYLFPLDSEEDQRGAEFTPATAQGGSAKNKPTTKKKRRPRRKPQLISQNFTVEEGENGFRIVPSPESNLGVGDLFEVRVGYDLSSGDPLATTNVDFNLRDLIQKDLGRSLKVTESRGNYCRFEIKDLDFLAVFAGFDTYRDLVVSVQNGD